MHAIRQSLKQWHWYHWTAVIIALLYLTYVALSYLYLPGKLKAIVQSEGSRMLGRTVTVQRIAFNPFTLSLTADQFAIADRPQQPLLSWQRLFVNFDAWGSLFGWKPRFSAMALDAPRIAIERRKHGFNFSDILDRLSKPARTPAKKSRPLALKVDDIRLNHGRFRFDDISGQKPARSAVRDITLHVQNLYLATGDRHLNPFHLQAAMPGGGRLRLDGQYSVAPLRVHTNVTAGDIHLAALSQFIENHIPIRLSDGLLTLVTGLDVSMADTLQVRLSGGNVRIAKLAVDDSTASPPLMRCNSIRLQGIGLDLAKRQFEIGTVTVDGFDTHQWLNAGGRSRIESVLARARSSPPPTNGKPASPWQVSIAKTVIKNSGLAFTDRRNGLDASQQVRSLNAMLGFMQLNSGIPVPVKLNAAINDNGTFDADGWIILSPFSADLHYHLNKLTLAPFNPYVKSMSWLELKQGALNVDGKVKINPKNKQALLLSMNTGIQGLGVLDTRSGKTVLQWKGLNIHQLQLDTGERRLTVDKVILDAPDLAARRGADNKIDLATLMKPAPGVKGEPGDKREASKTTAPWRVAIRTAQVQHGTMRFTDASMKPAFKGGLYALVLKIDRLTSAGPKPADFRLNARLNRSAPFTVKGTLAPLRRQPGFAFTSRLKGFEMPALSPYTGTYIGYKLKSGTLALSLKYNLARRTLKGRNSIVASQLYLGDEVKSAKAINLPVGLGLALLRGADGVIDLNVGVSGNIDDPRFSVSGIIFKALKNIVVKAATSPFRFLASLVGGSDDMGSIKFAGGTSTLSPKNRVKLRHVSEALTKRPQLVVTVTGCAGQAADDADLKMQHVLQQIADRRKIPVADLQPGKLLEEKANRKALRELNARLKQPDEGARKKTVSSAHPDLMGDALIQRVYRNMLDDVAARQTVTRQDRLALADQRALAIKRFLTQSVGLDNRRIQMKKTTEGDLKGRVCSLGLQPR